MVVEFSALFWPLPYPENFQPVSLSPPKRKSPGNFAKTKLLTEAARLSICYGVISLQTPGKINFRSQSYMSVFLIMALRFDSVCILVTDDLGVGKTVEAGFILKWLIECRAVSRCIILCLPYLFGQWIYELGGKFTLPAVVVSPKTIAKLEKKTTREATRFRYFKIERWRSFALTSRPAVVINTAMNFKIVNEIFTLVKVLAGVMDHHLILLIAILYNVIEDFFRTSEILGPSFKNLSFDDLNRDEREHEYLIRSFIQRTGDWVQIPFFSKDSLPYTLIS